MAALQPACCPVESVFLTCFRPCLASAGMQDELQAQLTQLREALQPKAGARGPVEQEEEADAFIQQVLPLGEAGIADEPELAVTGGAGPSFDGGARSTAAAGQPGSASVTQATAAAQLGKRTYGSGASPGAPAAAAAGALQRRREEGEEALVPIPTALLGGIGSLVGGKYRHVNAIQEASGVQQLRVKADEREGWVLVRGAPDAIQAARRMLVDHFDKMLDQSERMLLPEAVASLIALPVTAANTVPTPLYHLGISCFSTSLTASRGFCAAAYVAGGQDCLHR